MNSNDIPWWKKTTVYQIYPRSYMDSNGDGIGDLEGIISKLDYIKDLGVETIWFSPFFDSPQQDFGYDVRNYRDVAPEYGDMATAEKLIKEIHDLDMKIVLDMVLNHTSEQHQWFVESRSSRENPKRDWYVWRDGKKPGGKAPPNNWKAMITGSGWHYDETTDQWYWAQFLPFQPDLNYRNPEVVAEMLDTVRFWLKKGADGFRLDIINALFEDNQFRDNPSSWRLVPSEKSTAMLFQNPVHTLNHPDTLDFMKDLRAVLDEFDDPPRFMVGEVSAPLDLLKQYMGDGTDALHLTFQFQALGLPLSARKIGKLVKEFEHHFPDPYMPTWVFSNHDRFRRISRLGGDIDKGKLNVALQLTERGVPFLYYGEEVGMEQHHLPVRNSLDAVTFKFRKVPQFIFAMVRALAKESLNRDECRTPMQWSAAVHAGFCPDDAVPWLPVTPSAPQRNVEVQEDDPESMLACCKRFLAARRDKASLHSGSIAVVTLKGCPGHVLSYERVARDDAGDATDKVLVLLNCKDSKAEFKLEVAEGDLIVSTRAASDAIKDGSVALAPWEGIVVSR